MSALERGAILTLQKKETTPVIDLTTVPFLISSAEMSARSLVSDGGFGNAAPHEFLNPAGGGRRSTARRPPLSLIRLTSFWSATFWIRTSIPNQRRPFV